MYVLIDTSDTPLHPGMTAHNQQKSKLYIAPLDCKKLPAHFVNNINEIDFRDNGYNKFICNNLNNI